MPAVPTVPTLTVERIKCFYLINTNSHQVHQLINYFVFERDRKEIQFPRQKTWQKKWVHTGESYCNLQKCACCSNNVVKSWSFLRACRDLNNYTGFGGRSFATQEKNQISTLSQSAANIGWKISQSTLHCTGNKHVSVYSFMT
jgi:hypothetical protein